MDDNGKPAGEDGPRGDRLDGAPLYGPEGSRIGTILQVHGQGGATQVTVSLGGFLGLGTKTAVLSGSDLRFSRSEDGAIRAVTHLTTRQLAERSGRPAAGA